MGNYYGNNQRKVGRGMSWSFDPNEEISTVKEAGIYPCLISGVEKKFTKNGDGWYIHVSFNCNGDIFDDRLMMQHPSNGAVYYGKVRFQELCKAVGLTQKIDEQTLHKLVDKPVKVRVGVQPGRDGYGPQNVVEGYEPYKSPSANAPTSQAPKSLDDIPF